jgi:methyl-accepting chemotaxis protein
MLNKVTIKARLFIIVGLMIALLIGIGGFGLRSLSDFQNRLSLNLDSSKEIVKSIDTARTAQVHFKIQVQEWKNTLLRGFEREDFDKYFAGFTKEETIVQNQLTILKDLMTKQGMNTSEVDDLLKIHLSLGIKYREALKSYDPTKIESYQVVDKLVKGIDRPPTEAMDVIVTNIEEKAVTKFVDLETQSANEYSSVHLISIISLYYIFSCLTSSNYT